MAKRTPAQKPDAGDDWQITDEWGIYDPGKAGMPALFKRLGRPVLQASSKTTRSERRRAHRPERTTHGVGMALEEARRRAGLMPPDGFEPISQSPARAMRNALRHQPPAEPTHFVPAVAPPPVAHEPVLEPPVEAAAPAARRKRTAKRPAKAAAEVADAPQVTHPIAEPVVAKTHAATAVEHAPERPRARKPAPRPRLAASATAKMPAAVAPPAPPVETGPPAPSPRRPRGPVPLAAWAHTADPAPVQAPRRLDPLSFWRGWFRMPAEVALVEYARGARIHRLLIESVEDQPAELF